MYGHLNRWSKNTWHNSTIITSQQSGFEGVYLNIIKALCEQPTSNLILNNRKLNIFFFSGSGTSQGCPLSWLLFNIALEVLIIAIRHNKEIKSFQIKKKLKLYYLQVVWFCIYKSSKFNQQLWKLINKFSNVAGYKININKSVASRHTNNKISIFKKIYLIFNSNSKYL